MRRLNELTADKLLNVTEPEALFSRILSEAKGEYRMLARRWHPDLDKSIVSSRVFAHITELYQLATRKIANGGWTEPTQKVEEEVFGLKCFRCRNGGVKQIPYQAVRGFELGRMWIEDHSVTFEVRRDYEDLFRQGISQIKGLRFADQDMALEMARQLPQIIELFRTADANFVTVRKTPDQMLLGDVLSFCNGRIDPPEHIGWILNVLLNIACFLEWRGITHNAVSAQSVFISPLRHSGMLLGGWWYSRSVGDRLHVLPDASLPHVPPDILKDKLADTRCDLELIRALGRELFGDPLGAQFIFDKNIPQPIAQWLRLPSSGKATIDYASWKNDVLPAAFGTPKFFNWKLESKDIDKEA